MTLDFAAMNEDPDAPCYDEGHHEFEIDGSVVVCRRGCGAEMPIVELEPSEHRAILELPWTAPPLSLNARRATRGAMFAHARLVAEVRAEVHKLALAAGLPRGLDHVAVLLHYRPRDNRRRDTDNLVATLKPACDALAAGTAKHPGYGMVPDDIPRHMAKPEPIIHEAERGMPGVLWLEITWEA
ncbi:hypothetical protein [Nocardia sp. CA-145437]|uniref:hypothetical protein n=1 Tax=Nocardia sp. CA-145437 TaxID=3239980 RepID=UPI003D98A5CC